MKRQLLQKALEFGFDDCRVTAASAPESAPMFLRWLEAGRHGEMGYLARNAEKRANPQFVLPGAKSIIVLASSYSLREPQPLSAPGTGLVARYARHADYHGVLGTRLKMFTEWLNATAGAGTRSLHHIDTGPILERDLAQRAGLGFIGKHTSLISRKLGNWFFISEVLTTAWIEPAPPERNHCGTCTRCIAACPTGAIVAPFELDARLCISYLTIELKGPIPVELRPRIGNRIFGCDDCLAACPWNRFAREGAIMRDYKRPELSAPGLLELLTLDEPEFKKQFARTPMARAKRRGLLRNVCVALGNTAGAEALGTLQLAAQDPEPLIAEHARWAIERIRARIDAEQRSGGDK